MDNVRRSQRKLKQCQDCKYWVLNNPKSIALHESELRHQNALEPVLQVRKRIAPKVSARGGKMARKNPTPVALDDESKLPHQNAPEPVAQAPKACTSGGSKMAKPTSFNPFLIPRVMQQLGWIGKQSGVLKDLRECSSDINELTTRNHFDVVKKKIRVFNNGLFGKVEPRPRGRDLSCYSQINQITRDSWDPSSARIYRKISIGSRPWIHVHDIRGITNSNDTLRIMELAPALQRFIKKIKIHIRNRLDFPGATETATVYFHVLAFTSQFRTLDQFTFQFYDYDIRDDIQRILEVVRSLNPKAKIEFKFMDFENRDTLGFMVKYECCQRLISLLRDFPNPVKIYLDWGAVSRHQDYDRIVKWTGEIKSSSKNNYEVNCGIQLCIHTKNWPKFKKNLAILSPYLHDLRISKSKSIAPMPFRNLFSPIHLPHVKSLSLYGVPTWSEIIWKSCPQLQYLLIEESSIYRFRGAKIKLVEKRFQYLIDQMTSSLEHLKRFTIKKPGWVKENNDLGILLRTMLPSSIGLSFTSF